MDDRKLEDFLALPVDADEIWQGGIASFAQLLGIPPDADPDEMAVVLWRSVATELVHGRPFPAARQEAIGELVDVMLEFCTMQGFTSRPARIECSDRALADALGRLVADSGTTARFVRRMPAWDSVLQELADQFGLMGQSVPSLMDVGCKESQVREFADAAAAFYRARLWDYLTDVDLVQIEKPKPPRGLRFAVVLGAGAHTYGLGFYNDCEDHYDMMADRADPRELSLFSLTFDSPADVPSADVDLWKELDLTLETGEAFPSLNFFSPEGAQRPTPKQLEFVTVVLKALAETGEDDIDSGRWTKSVKLRGRARQCILSIPNLLDPPDRQEWIRRGMMPEPRGHERHFKLVEEFIRTHGEEMSLEELNAEVNARFTGPMDDIEYSLDTPADRAEALCQQAIDNFGRRRIQLARQALAEDATHVEANVLLAEATRQADRRVELFRQAAETAKTQLGPAMDEVAGHFWGITETRPFMRACHGLADALREAGQPSEAVAQYQEMLRLNPNDNQGVRYEVVPLLLGLGRESEASELLDRYQEETALWHYTNSLAEFRRRGRSPQARKALQRAFRANKHVLALLESEDPPSFPDSYALGSPEEAATCVHELIDAWNDTEGYVAWMFQEYPKWEKAEKKQLRERQQKKQGKKSGRTRGP